MNMSLPSQITGLHVKNNWPFMSCLAPRWHELLEHLMFFSWAQTQTHSTSCDSESSILLIFFNFFYERTYFLFLPFFFVFHFSSPLLKDKPIGSGEARWQTITICQGRRYSWHKLCLLKRVLCEKGHWEAKGDLLLEKCGCQCRYDTGIRGLFPFANLTFFFIPQLTSVYMSKGRECGDTDLDVHARCFLSASYCLSQFSFPWCSALMIEDKRGERWSEEPVGMGGFI